MSDFKNLVEAYRAVLSRSTAAEHHEIRADGATSDTGFGEASAGYSAETCAEELEKTESACLNFPVISSCELQSKVDFLLNQMRELTEQEEEFDRYASILKKDVEAYLDDKAENA